MIKDRVKRVKQRLCRHRYLDKNLVTTRYKHNIIFANKCVKCGKEYCVWVSENDVESWINSDLDKLGRL